MRFIITKASRFLAALLGVCLLALPLGALADGAAALPPERDQELKNRLQAAIDDILNTETIIVHANDYIPGETYTGRAFYVSSSTGNDNNDGLSPETAWASLNHACFGAFGGDAPEFGDAVFFKRGDIFRFTEDDATGLYLAKPGITFSAYGEGPKPILTPSPENGTGAEKWKLYYSDDTGMKIWEFYRPMQDMACVVLNNEIIVRRVYEAWTPETGYISCTNENYLCESDCGVTLLDRLYAPEEALTEDRTFICRPEVIDPANGSNLGAPGAQVYNPDGVGPLYVRYDAGNPGELFESIEFARRWMQGTVWLRASDITLDNLSFRYSGIAEIKNGLMEAYEMMRGTVIQNCEFAFGGGAVAFYMTYPSGENTVMAQGDGIYTVVSDATFRHNYFHDRREGAVSFECAMDKPIPYSGYFHVLDNVMVNTMGMYLDTTSDKIKYLDEMILRGNQVWNTGALDDGGYVYSYGSIFTQNQFFDRFEIRDNVFYCSEPNFEHSALLNIFCYRGDLLGNDIDFSNNVYVQHDGWNFAFFLAHGETWRINDPDLKEKARDFLGDTTSEFYILPDSPAE